jgi:iron-sulfur cluster repair protein YtfE (RIC family)
MLTAMEAKMDFNSETKMKDIALSNPAARQVLEDARLDYCCGSGGKPLSRGVPSCECLVGGNIEALTGKRQRHRT